MRTLWLAVTVISVVSSAPSAHAQHAQPVPPTSARPAADSIPMTSAQIARFKALNDQYRPKFQALITASHKTPGDTNILRQAKALQAEYTAAYQAILTPQQRTQLAQAEAAARAKAVALPKPRPPLMKKNPLGGTSR